MNELVEVNTSELTGPALDWAVGKCSGMPFFTMGEDWPGNYNVTVMAGENPILILDLVNMMWREHQGITVPWSPSTDWAQGGPLCDKYRVSLEQSAFGCGVRAQCWADGSGNQVIGFPSSVGDTALVAISRAIVAAELGEVIKAPKVLFEVEL